MNKTVKYLICSVICHGECEMQVVSFIQNRYRRDLNPIGDKNGSNSIEINTLNTFLKKHFPSISEYIESNKSILNLKKKTIINHKIFSIIDKDSTSDKMMESYIDKTMFKPYWWGETNLIEPIYFIPNMDAVFNKHGFKIDVHRKKPQQYYKLLSTHYDEVIKMLDSLPESESNIKVFLDYVRKNA